MKILQLIQKPQLRGAEIFASQLSTHLQAQGHEVKIVCLLEGSATLPFDGPVINLKRPLSRRFWDWAGWKRLAHEINYFQPDVVQANAGDTLKFAVFSKLLFGWRAPIVFRNANKVSDFVNSTPKLLFNKFLVRQVQYVVSVSELCRQDFCKTYRYAEGKTTTVPIGIEVHSFDTRVPADLASVFADGKVLVHVASFVSEKNHIGLLRILERLRAAGENVKLLLVGDGKLRAVVEQKIKELDLQDCVLLLGYRSDVLSIMTNASAFLLPSNVEGLPGVILEAMYCRTPVVAYDVGGISEVIKNGETGWLVPARDEQGFAEAVQQVFQCDADEHNTITDAAYALVLRDFDNRAIARRFEEVYNVVSRGLQT